jgi:hypothetical protein
MKVQYLIGDGHSGRTTEMLEDMLRVIHNGWVPFFVCNDAHSANAAMDWLEQHGVKRPWLYVSTNLTIQNGCLQGRKIEILYIDNFDYMGGPLSAILSFATPGLYGVIVSLTGEIYERREVVV